MTTHQEISRPEKVLYPAPGYTKADLAAHFERLADVVLQHLAGRPLVLYRFPDGVGESGFFQKQAPEHAPDVVDTVTVSARNERGNVQHLVIGSVDGGDGGAEALRYLANLACVEVHRWLARADAIDNPDLLVIDLDPPPERDLDVLRDCVRATRDLIEGIGLTPYLMATGGSGYHVVAPLDREAGFDEVRELARPVAERLAADAPEERTTEQRIVKRGDRVFFDVNRNAYAQTAIAPYSPRAREGAPVAVPIEFGELGRTAPDSYDLGSIRRRLARKADPWADIHEHAGSAARSRQALAD